MEDKLRIGIALTDNLISDWKHTLIQKVIAQQTGRIVAFLKVEEQAKNFGLWKKHVEIDAQYFKPRPDAFHKVNIETKFSSIPLLNDKNKIRDLSLDIIIWLSDNPVKVDDYPVSVGILSFAHGETNNQSESFLGYWEFIKLQEVITSALLIHTKSNTQARILYRTWSMMQTISISRSRNQHMWKLASLVPRALAEIDKNGANIFLSKIDTYKKLEVVLKNKNYLPPSTSQTLVNFAKHFYRMAYKAFRKFAYKEQWIILLNMNQGASTSFSDFKKILPPKDCFWADPFLVEQDGKQYLFVEELPFATDKGHLSVMEIDEHGTVSPIVKILDKPYHLSYPFIFELEGKHYMIPESYEDKSIQLYECTSFPFQWEHKMNLMSEIAAFDTTLFFYENKWWLFTVISEQRGSGHNDELFLFFADTPFTSDWTSHPQNPVISDVRLARPAGNIYEEDGKLIRPSQDCAKKYGYGFNLNEIEVLTETAYREKRIKNIRPDWDRSISRTHSFNHLPNATVIDAVIQRSRFF